MKKRILAFVTVVVLAVLVPGVMLAQSNPSAGTWKLNTAKSKFSPDPAPKSLTLTLEAQDGGIKASSEGTATDGSATAWSYTANYDGKDNPISGTGPGEPIPLTLSGSTRTRPKSTFKKAGKVVRTPRLVVSKDGKGMTITAKGTNANGQPVSDVLVFDKQRAQGLLNSESRGISYVGDQPLT